MLQRHTTKPQTLRFSSHTSLFWTLPEQLSILHHACVPTHPEDTPQNLRTQDVHLTHPSFELCRSSSPYYTTHVWQPWTNVPKIHHKISDPKIFISHIPVLNFAGAALHITPCMWANPSWRHTTKSQTPRFLSHTSLFWTLPEQLSIIHHACEPTHPEPTSQDTVQISIRKFSSHTSLFWTLPNRLHLACVPTLNQCCTDTTQNLRP